MSDPLSITFCAYDGAGYFGGPLEWYKRLAPALRDVCVETQFLFITDHKPEQCGTYMGLKKAGFECHALRRHSLTQLGDNTEARVRWILRHLRNKPPDLFVPNLSIPGCFAARWAQEAGIPAVPVIHSDDDFYRGMTEEFLVRPGPFRLKASVCVSEMLTESLRSKCHAVELGPVEFAARRSPPTFPGARVNSIGSECSGDVVVERIPCGTPIPEQQTQWPGAEPLRIAYVGRFVDKAKRIRLLAEAFCRAVREVANVEAVLIGDGLERRAVEQIVADMDCGGRVVLTGRIDSTAIQDHLLGCHVIVLLSDFEGLPVTLIEGMACGLVPVCLDIRSGIPELVKHGETGLLVEDRGDDFVRAIRQLREQPELWERLSRAARLKVEGDYSMACVAGQWKQLAERLQAEAGGKRRIRVPRRLDLPPVHPKLGGDDRRWPGWGGYVRQLVRRVSRRCRRRLKRPTNGTNERE